MVESGIAAEKLREDFRRRCELRIPPGFKDARKPEGIGDVEIWHTILRIGRDEKRNVVFVTNEQKNDWMEQSAGQALAVRYELVDEFRRAAGKDFATLDFAGFLKAHHVKPEVLVEVESSARDLSFGKPNADSESRRPRELLAHFWRIAGQMLRFPGSGLETLSHLMGLGKLLSDLRECTRSEWIGDGLLEPAMGQLLGQEAVQKLLTLAERAQAAIGQYRDAYGQGMPIGKDELLSTLRELRTFIELYDSTSASGRILGYLR
jgi:hypothetical protein